jgi:gliding motility associated protien GldN
MRKSQICWKEVAVKGILLFYLFTFLPLAGTAQPANRRRRPANTTTTTPQNTQGQLTQRARLMFPTAIDMPEDVVWRRDIYREIDLTKDANGGLYYPVEPVGHDMNLFTYVFKLVQNGYVPAYEYRLDGNEVFSDSARVKFKTLLSDYHIFYEEKDGKIRVDNSDIPSQEVRLYYLKESAYYDQSNSTFHRKVLALCPVMLREDDFGGEAAKYPLFWVKYSDLEPFLSRQTVMTSSLNNAATMSMSDYFTLNMYSGKIYKTNNMLGRTLAQYCPTDTAMAKEQERIEEELAAFERGLFATSLRGDTANVDSTANTDEVKPVKETKKKKKTRRQRVSTSSGNTSSGGGTGSSPRISVRRQRH